MFPDSEIAKNYRQGETKVRCNIQFGIVPYIKDLLVKGFSDCPFSLKFDETATHKVLKQYNAYVQYWSKNYDCIVNSYCGSLLVTKHAQYLHPERRSDSNPTSARSNLCLTVGNCVKNVIQNVFALNQGESVEELCDKVRTQ